MQLQLQPIERLFSPLAAAVDRSVCVGAVCVCVLSQQKVVVVVAAGRPPTERIQTFTCLLLA